MGPFWTIFYPGILIVYSGKMLPSASSQNMLYCYPLHVQDIFSLSNDHFIANKILSDIFLFIIPNSLWIHPFKLNIQDIKT